MREMFSEWEGCDCPVVNWPEMIFHGAIVLETLAFM